MAQYRATTKTFVDGRLVEAGETFSTSAKPSKTWQALADKADDKADKARGVKRGE